MLSNKLTKSLRGKPSKKKSNSNSSGSSESSIESQTDQQKNDWPTTSYDKANESEQLKQISIFKVGKWLVKGSLRISFSKRPSNWESFEKILECIVDQYDGNKIYKAVTFCVYWCLGFHLKECSGPSNRFSYGADIEEIMNFAHEIPLLVDQNFSFSLNESGSFRGVSYSIQSSIVFMKTNRKSYNFEQFIYSGSYVPREERSFKELLNDCGIPTKESEERLILK